MTTTTTTAPTVTRGRLYAMMRAYKQTALLRTASDLGIFDAIASGASTAADVARSVGADERGTRILLDALAALELVSSDRGTYALDTGAKELLVRSSPAYYGGMSAVVASDAEWEAMRRLGDAVRAGGTVVDTHAETPGYDYWETFAASVSPVMNPASVVLADQVADWAGTDRPLRVLDVACGHGLHGFAIADRLPHARVWGLDWDNVLPHRRAHARQRGLDDRVQDIAGDMFTADLGGPYDLVLVTNVLHHFSEDRCAELLRRARAVLAPGGRIGVVGFVVDENQEPAADPDPHLFSVLMLAWTHEGEVHSTSGYDRILAASGLRKESARDVPGLPFHVVLASAEEQL